MKYYVTALQSESVYLAQLSGPSAKYRFERDFLQGTKQPLRSHQKSGPRVRYRFDLKPAIYERSVDFERSYFAVIGTRCVSLDLDIVEELSSLCSKHNFLWQRLVEIWIASRNKAKEGLAKVIADCKREIEETRRESRRNYRAQRKPQRFERVSAVDVFEGSDPALTRMYLVRLERLGDEGKIAAELFRAQKSSTRAKAYRGRYRDYAYDRKSEVMEMLVAHLEAFGQFRWGWKPDPDQSYAPWVLYIDLPQGQVSFHARSRGSGPEYAGEWDQQHVSSERVLQFCDSLMESVQDAA